MTHYVDADARQKGHRVLPAEEAAAAEAKYQAEKPKPADEWPLDEEGNRKSVRRFGREELAAPPVTGSISYSEQRADGSTRHVASSECSGAGLRRVEKAAAEVEIAELKAQIATMQAVLRKAGLL